MAQHQKTKRTQTKDLTVSEKEITKKEMEKVQGGKSFYESRSNVARKAGDPIPEVDVSIGKPGQR